MEAIIKIDMFTKTQKVYIKEPISYSGFYVSLEELPEFLMQYKNLEKVHIFGNNEYITKIVQNIKEKELNKYNTNAIEFCINK